MKRVFEILREEFSWKFALLMIGISFLVYLLRIVILPYMDIPPATWGSVNWASCIMGFFFGVIMVIPVRNKKEFSFIQRSVIRLCGFFYYGGPIFVGGAIALLILT